MLGSFFPSEYWNLQKEKSLIKTQQKKKLRIQHKIKIKENYLLETFFFSLCFALDDVFTEWLNVEWKIEKKPSRRSERKNFSDGRRRKPMTFSFFFAGFLSWNVCLTNTTTTIALFENFTSTAWKNFGVEKYSEL